MKLRVAKRIYKRWVHEPVILKTIYIRQQPITKQRDRWKKKTLAKVLELRLYQRFLPDQVATSAW